MSCPHCFYKEEEISYPRLYCKISGNYCLYTKKCIKHEKYIPIEGDKFKECFMYIDQQRKSIPSGAYFIQSSRPNRNGKLYLYVVIKDRVERILSNFENIDQDYVYLRRKDDGYEVSLRSFARKNKRNE